MSLYKIVQQLYNQNSNYSYLFWTIQDQLIGGLYRLDISDISNGVKYEVKVDRILNETNLGSLLSTMPIFVF